MLITNTHFTKSRRVYGTGYMVVSNVVFLYTVDHFGETVLVFTINGKMYAIGRRLVEVIRSDKQTTLMYTLASEFTAICFKVKNLISISIGETIIINFKCYSYSRTYHHPLTTVIIQPRVDIGYIIGAPAQCHIYSGDCIYRDNRITYRIITEK